jgi:hypothetical protein
MTWKVIQIKRIEMTNLKLWEVNFSPMWPVPCVLIILAETEQDAWVIARETIKHTEPREVKERPLERGVVIYESGDY